MPDTQDEQTLSAFSEEPASYTTEGVTREQVDRAMDYLGIHNPKKDIPIETTIAGHTIVAVADNIRRLRRYVQTQVQLLKEERA
jgi:hypothetical protein